MTNIFKKEFKVLGRSKKIRALTDVIFLAILALFLGWFVKYSISKLDLGSALINVVSEITKKPTTTEAIVEPEKKCINPVVKSYALYYTDFGDQIGIGPNPPIIDIPTNYWIFFEINNNQNNLKNIKITASLPDNVTLTGNRNILSGDFKTTEGNREIIWSIDNILQKETTKLRFEVSLIPNNENFDKVLNIIQNIKFSATDEFCEKEIFENLQNIDTQLIYDKFGTNSGKVTSAENAF